MNWITADAPKKDDTMKIIISHSSWLNGTQRRVYELPVCKDGYPKKKPWKAFLAGLRGLKNNKVRVEVSDES